MGFLVHALCYGDHAGLARRCLDSIAGSADWSVVDSVCVGLSDACAETRDYVASWAERLPVPAVVVSTGGENPGKYSVMRRMFYVVGPPAPAGSRVMWFDDDSYVRGGSGSRWWNSVWAAAQGCTLLGSQYTQPVLGGQWTAVTQQPWYGGAPPVRRFRFCQGAWWVADPGFLRRWDYPFPALRHNGGDVLLGELCRQQGARVRHFNEGVAINADAGGVESKAARRGLSTRPLWRDYDGRPDDLAHHRWVAEVSRYGGS